ncbi:hypothetical protein [Leptospira kmetyi]|uniref:Uncharacterized protein n=1 Tax=Leptospira kmetyi TaxID=408139 RepID=A0ABX4N907_9LEPT|nr:hypothetical protein [Leptospira kmetyi]PJZ29063.1 hypothetical protein CH378_14325 [Leptospira kmetyi]PJZ39693.1 hypothetical protein CH370_19760 [Leptospira kmetyi]
MEELKEIPKKKGNQNQCSTKAGLLFLRYKWKERENDFRVFEHRFLTNLQARIRNEKGDVVFSVKGNPGLLIISIDGIEETLEYIDSNYSHIKDLRDVFDFLGGNRSELSEAVA